MITKIPLKHDTRYAQHFAKVSLGRYQRSEVELLKAVIANRSILRVWQGFKHASNFAELFIWKEGGFSE